MPRLLPSVSVLALVATTPAFAQVSAADLWAEWQATAAATDQEMTADVTETGDGLILENFRTRTVSGDSTTLGALDRITLTDMADGSVSVELSQPYVATLTFPEDAGGPVITAQVLVSYEGLNISVARTNDALSYDILADTLRVDEGEISNDRGDPPPTFDIAIVARDLDTNYTITGDGADQRFESNGSTGSVSARFDLRPPEGEDGQLKISFASAELNSESTGSMIALSAMQQDAGGLPDGYDVAGDVAYDWLRLDVSFDDTEQSFSTSYTNEGGSFGIALSNDEIRFSDIAEQAEVQFSASESPVPVQYSAASTELVLAIPLSASDTPSDAAVRFAYRDVMVNDELWAMMDPAAIVPRNPITAVLDATAQVQILADLLSEETMAMDQPPGELRALSVSELEISFGDTSLTGTADMTFAPGQAVPQPVGQADLSLVGGNALLDQLQSAGVINAEQAGMARGVAGMFSRPGALPDTLETTIEFLEGGSITANGVPLQ